jgi:pimeloyl-ACP methyl ester carboxylesterase
MTLWLANVALFAALVATQPGYAAPAASQVQIAPYLVPQQLLPIDEGRKINLVCLGHGSPTIILTAGLGDWSMTWRLVQRPLAKRTRVCAWDRAGYGFSSPSRQPQDVIHTTEDLEQTLKAAGIQGPYVMVGHSRGAYEALRFTDLHPRQVVGMVLEDPAIPDQFGLLGSVAPKVAEIFGALSARTVKDLQDCAAGLQNGTLKVDTSEFVRCTAVRLPPEFSRLAVALEKLNADPSRLVTEASLTEYFPQSSHEVVDMHRNYGGLPLIVLTAGREAVTLQPGTPGAATPVETAEFHQQLARYLKDAWRPAHDAYAALSTRGRHQLVNDAGHGIQIERPEVVISAVAEVLHEIHP